MQILHLTSLNQSLLGHLQHGALEWSQFPKKMGVHVKGRFTEPKSSHKTRGAPYTLPVQLRQHSTSWKQENCFWCLEWVSQRTSIWGGTRRHHIYHTMGQISIFTSPSRLPSIQRWLHKTIRWYYRFSSSSASYGWFHLMGWQCGTFILAQC